MERHDGLVYCQTDTQSDEAKRKLRGAWYPRVEGTTRRVASYCAIAGILARTGFDGENSPMNALQKTTAIPTVNAFAKTRKNLLKTKSGSRIFKGGMAS